MDDDDDDLEGYDEGLHDGQFSDSDEELVQEPRYARQEANGGRHADAFGEMGAELGEDDSELDSEITDDAEDELLGYGAADDDVLNDTDDDF